MLLTGNGQCKQSCHTNPNILVCEVDDDMYSPDDRNTYTAAAAKTPRRQDDVTCTRTASLGASLRAVGSQSSTTFMERSQHHCWWCCHTFDTIAVPQPIAYDTKKNLYVTRGTFCSFGCAKAFILSQNKIRKGHECMWLKKLYVDLTGRHGDTIVASPNRHLLTMFGGTMSIDKFREHGKVIHKGDAYPGVQEADLVGSYEAWLRERTFKRGEPAAGPSRPQPPANGDCQPARRQALASDRCMPPISRSVKLSRNKEVVRDASTLENYMGIRRG